MMIMVNPDGAVSTDLCAVRHNGTILLGTSSFVHHVTSLLPRPLRIAWAWTLYRPLLILWWTGDLLHQWLIPYLGMWYCKLLWDGSKLCTTIERGICCEMSFCNSMKNISLQHSSTSPEYMKTLLTLICKISHTCTEKTSPSEPC